MKSISSILIILLSLIILFYQCEKEPNPNDIVDIPDQHFLNALIEDGADKNGDGCISYVEAEMVTKIYLDPDSASMSKGKISSLEGIEAFTNLDTIHCCGNQIKELDVSANADLRVLVCWNSAENEQLELLNVTGNTKLEVISIIGTLLKDLDVSKCPSLYSLICSYNQITNLDVSKNTNLGRLWCDGNQLSKLDISNNINLGKGNEPWINSISPALTIGDMPTLKEVCVWTLPFPPNGFYGFELVTTGSPNVYFTTACSN